jgi:formate hydrogenlyase subunit 3/multisubunit Na+/H+ antiporter MnhD subunit
VFSLDYLEPDGRGRALAALTSAFLLAMALVLCARDPLTFLVGWELMTLVPAVVILVSRSADRLARRWSRFTQRRRSTARTLAAVRRR